MIPYPLPKANPDGYFLYHSIGMYPGKEEDMTREMAEFARVYSAPNDKQWGYILRKRQDFIDYWRYIINAPKKTITACDSVTQGVHSVVTGLPEKYLKGRKVLVSADCFPSVHFLLAGLAPRLGFELETVPLRQGATWVESEDFAKHWDKDVGLALSTWVTSTASARCDLDALVEHGRTMDSVIGVDITQAAGLLPFDVQGPKIDFAVSTSLKWMCGTPGAGIIYMDTDLVRECRPELRGWFSQNNPFSWALDKFSYAPDIRRFDSGTPASMAAIASVPALQWHAEQDRDAIVRHNLDLVNLIIAKADDLGLPLQSPREAAKRGGSLMLKMPSKGEAGAVVGALGVEGISVDFRDQVMRFSPGVITRPEMVEKAFDIVGSVMEKRSHRFAGKQPKPGQANQDAKSLLADLGASLLSGGVRIVDCTADLGPDTPILRLPKGFAVDTPKVEINKIS
ncbi:MAG TPA: aminotransferase class V-fold PLP-dependent enzyme, partial [Rhizobiaceae bacterium]|nr:aminotransferase class V-fold PLP-dependent enzyme [Rhizobiaceae bacterium]